MTSQQQKEFMAQLQQLGMSSSILAPFLANNTFDDFQSAMTTGGISTLVNPATNQPFTAEEQALAEQQGTNDIAGARQAEIDYQTQAAQNSLAQKQADYQDYLINQGKAFEADKSKLDQTAADQGVLFSGMRGQKEKALQDTYAQEQQSKLATISRSMNQTGQDFSYKYGSDAGKGLSNLYNLGGNQYNAGVATGGATSGGLSNVYNAGVNQYQGTQQNAYKAAAQQRAAGYLWNKGNKQLSTGLNNQYK